MLFFQVDKLEDGLDMIRSKPKPLAAYLFTNDEQLKKDYVQNISSGGMLINDAILHVNHSPLMSSSYCFLLLCA